MVVPGVAGVGIGDGPFAGMGDEFPWTLRGAGSVGQADPLGPCRGAHGSGGLGETRLAAQVSQRVLAVLPDGVFFVGFASIDADTVDNAIAEGLGVRREPQRSLFESVVVGCVIVRYCSCSTTVTT